MSRSNGRSAPGLAATAAAALLIVVGLSACSGPKGQSEPAAPVDPPADFVVDGPKGATVAPMRMSKRLPDFSEDCCGGAHPAVLLVPDDWSGMQDRRWVWVTSVDGSENEFGLYSEIPAHIEDLMREEPFELQGHPALAGENTGEIPAFVAVNSSVSFEMSAFSKASGDDSFDMGDKRGLVVTGPSASLDELKAIAKSAREAEPHRPVVDDPPDGWRVMATLTGAQAMDDTAHPLPDGVRGATVEIDAPAGADSGPLTVHVYSIEGDAAAAEALAIKGLWAQYDPDLVRTSEPFSTGEASGWCTTSTVRNWGSSECWFTVAGRPFAAWVGVRSADSTTPVDPKSPDLDAPIVEEGSPAPTTNFEVAPPAAPVPTTGVEAAPQADPDLPALLEEAHRMLLEVIDSIRVIG